MPKILVVEDDFLIQMTIVDNLEDAGFEVIGPAASAEDAGSLATEHSPDLILMDINLGSGNKDGIMAAKAIRETSAVPIMFLTAYADDNSRERMASIGPIGVLSKPYDNDQLIRAIQGALNGKG